jgi:hypothetical protein
MDAKVEEIILIAERVALHVRHGIPPEAEEIDRLQKLIDVVRKEHGLPQPINKSLPGTA